MTTKPKTLSLIQTSFPGRDQVIERAYHEHRSFRELCDDYRKCVVTIQRWKQLELDQPVQRSQEYAELLGELRSEIQTWLEAVESSHLF
jgi:hypothetical protein